MAKKKPQIQHRDFPAFLKNCDPQVLELYDTIMGEIEPELTSAYLFQIDEMYADESAAQKEIRGTRYAKAYEEFERRFQAGMDSWKADITANKGEILAYAQERVKDKDKDGLSSIEQQFQNA